MREASAKSIEDPAADGSETAAKKDFGNGGWTAHYILIICSLLYMVNYMDRQVLSVVMEPMKLDLGLTDTQMGIIQTMFLMSVAIFSFPMAFMIDRWSRRKAISIMAFLWSIATFVTGLGRSFLGVLIPRSLVGVGEAGFSAGGMAMITAAYPEKSRGKAVGVFNMAISLGGAIGVMLGGWLSVKYGGWRTPFYVFAVPGIILGILALFMKDYKTVAIKKDSTGEQAGFFKDAVRLCKIPSLRWLYLGYGVMNILTFGLLVWMPAFFMRSQGISEGKAGLLMGLIMIIGMLGGLLGGYISDKWYVTNRNSRLILAAIGSIGSASLAIIGILLNMQGIGLVVMLLFSVVNTLGLPALGVATQEVVEPRFKGMAYGMTVFCMYVLGGGWAPALVGGLSDALGGGAGGLKYALLITSTAGIVAGVFFLAGSRHFSHDCDKVKDFVLEAE